MPRVVRFTVPMAETRSGPRGSYAKGVAKREEILERALEVIAREGYRGASVKVIADAVGLSQAGLLHYFESKEELFVEILRKRDTTDQARMASPAEPGGVPDLRDGFVQVMRHNADVPGLVQLYARLSVEATDPEHPAHDYFIDRSRAIREAITATVAGGADTGGLSATTYARVLQAVADGLQGQWLLEPELDMARVIEEFLGALESSRADASPLPKDESA